MEMYEIISKKKYKIELNNQEIRFFINGYVDGTIPDYQVSALLMAILLNGFTYNETIEMTKAIVESGEQIDLSKINGIKVDKHSTGGVGDKTTLIVAPLVAACGISVAKMSGKGLGHTGGTIDKLESIEGLKTAFTKEEFINNVNKIGICIAGQTSNIAPADKKLYALRDVTATVDSIPLIAASIMSKKIASGSDKILLDVKCGNGAFMKNMQDAKKLANIMIKIGESLNIKTRAIITDMNKPLGRNVGNILEVIEAIDVLKGNGEQNLLKLSIEIAANMLNMANYGTMNECRNTIQEKIEDRSGLNKFYEMIENQGGDIHSINRINLDNYISYKSKENGVITKINTELIGKAALSLGAGREKIDSKIDYDCGLIFIKTLGDNVNKGDEIIRIYENRKDSEEAIKILDNAIEYVIII